MKITLITATYNSESTLQATIDSVRKQDYHDIEYIVVDGLSVDNTSEIVASNKNLISLVISEKDDGIYDALNKGVKAATGDVVGFVHSDDILADRLAVSRVAQCFNNNDTEAVYGDLQYVDRSNTSRIIRQWKSQEYSSRLFYKGWMPAHPTFYLKREAYIKFGVYRTDFKIAADYELMLRMLVRHKLPVQYIPHVLVKMRIGGESNVSLANRWIANKEDRRAWTVNDLKPTVLTRWLKPLSKISQFWT